MDPSWAHRLFGPAQLIGKTYPLSHQQRDAFARRETTAALVSLSLPEHRFERVAGRLLEVYRPVVTPGGQGLLFETYSSYATVASRRAEVWRSFAPITVGALILFQLCQLPLVWALVRRLRAGLHERARLLRQAIDASDDERRRISGNVHDTVVQGLLGASYAVEGAVEPVERAGQREVADRLRRAAQGIRESVRGLRSVLLEVYPPSVATAGLALALQDAVAPLRAQGIDVTARTPAELELPLAVESLVFRVAQESLRNVARHSRARTSGVCLDIVGRDVVLEVADDGAGFDVDSVLRRRDGHVGLRSLADLVADAGAILKVASTPGAGIRVRLEVQLP